MDGTLCRKMVMVFYCNRFLDKAEFCYGGEPVYGFPLFLRKGGGHGLDKVIFAVLAAIAAICKEVFSEEKED